VSGAHPEEVVRHPVLHQRWETITFLHWPYEARAVARLLPTGMAVDTFGERAWVGVTPFLMRDVRAPGLPPVPRWSSFPETNVRTYVRAPDGHDGVWFLSLDTSRLAQVLTVRTGLGVPYAWSRMRLDSDGGRVRYASHRHGPGARAGSRITIAIGDPLTTEDLGAFDHFLTGRWRAYSRRCGSLWVVPIEHEPWPLRSAEVMELDENLVAATGLPPPRGAPVIHYSPGVEVRIGAPPPLVAPAAAQDAHADMVVNQERRSPHHREHRGRVDGDRRNRRRAEPPRQPQARAGRRLRWILGRAQLEHDLMLVAEVDGLEVRAPTQVPNRRWA
jgi:uncharacterized protein